MKKNNLITKGIKLMSAIGKEGLNLLGIILIFVLCIVSIYAILSSMICTPILIGDAILAENLMLALNYLISGGVVYGIGCLAVRIRRELGKHVRY